MKNRESIKITLCFLTLLFTGCTSQSSFLTEQKEGWFNDPETHGLLYCRANIKNDGSADPTCFQAGFRVFEEGRSVKK